MSIALIDIEDMYRFSNKGFDVYPEKVLIERERKILDIKEACYRGLVSFYGQHKTSNAMAAMDACLNVVLDRLKMEGMFDHPIVLSSAKVKVIWNELDPRDFFLEFEFGNQERHFHFDER